MIARVAAQPEAIARECQQRDRADHQGEHAPARVGEVEAEQRNRDRRHGGEAEQRPRRPRRLVHSSSGTAIANIVPFAFQ